MLRLTRELPPLGLRDPTLLENARLELHHAVQLLAAFGQNFTDPREDDSHRSLDWADVPDSPAQAAFLSEPASHPRDLRLALVVADLRIELRDGSEPLASIALQGRRLDEAYAWLARVAAEAAGQPPSSGLARPEYDLPEHPVAVGSSFSTAGSAESAELARWYETGHLVLGALHAQGPNAAPVRTWPHHFDMGTLLAYPPTDPGGAARSVSVGLSPGDGGYPEPYWYVTPYPYPHDPELPVLEAGGHWHTEGWTGAVLSASEHRGLGDAADQARQITDFIAEALAGSRQLLAL